VLKRVFKIYSDYNEAKQHAAEHSLSVLESKSNPFFAVGFSVVTILIWLAAMETDIGPVPLFETYGFYPVVLVLIISYFSFFFGSKIICKTTVEELEDDTSTLGIFSACTRRELRSLISLGLAFLHTVIFFLYLISKDPKLMELF
jgi:hypothetical protein